MLRNDVNDAVLKAKLAQVEIGFKEDEFLYLICAYPALTDMIQRGMDKIAAVLEKETGKSFELRTTTKDEYEKWREDSNEVYNRIRRRCVCRYFFLIFHIKILICENFDIL